jgi:NADH-quinone oxidoreductase subunit M
LKGVALLPFLILLPFGAAVLLAVLRFSGANRVRWVSLLAAVATLLVSLAIANDFRSVRTRPHEDPVHPRMEWRHAWMTYNQPVAGSSQTREVRCEFYLGLDGISLLLIVLTTLLTVSSILVSWHSVSERVTEFYVCLLVLEAGLIGVFCAFDLLLFYVFFEFTLIPLFLLVGIWGGPQRRYAAGKFFIYTLTGSVVTLVGLVALVVNVSSIGELASPFSIPDIARVLSHARLDATLQWWLFLALSAGFMIKVPLFPFHTWLPLAHVEAPTAGSVLLAGVLLKLGTYGFLRLCLPLLPDACVQLGVPLIVTLSLAGIIYGALCALAQTDIKKLVAYSSISHLGFCMLGLFARAFLAGGHALRALPHPRAARPGGADGAAADARLGDGLCLPVEHGTAGTQRVRRRGAVADRHVQVASGLRGDRGGGGCARRVVPADDAAARILRPAEGTAPQSQRSAHARPQCARVGGARADSRVVRGDRGLSAAAVEHHQ